MTNILKREHIVHDSFAPNSDRRHREAATLLRNGLRYVPVRLELTRQAAYKSEIYGGTFHQTDQWFPSSKTCRVCGQIKKDLKLSDRVYLCDGCGHEEDRDLNAAHNILAAGLAVTAHGPGSSGSCRKAKVKPRRVEVRT